MKRTLQIRRLQLLLLFLLIPLVQTIGQEEFETECPYFNVVSNDSSGVAFALISTDVNATISGVIANVIVEQTYLNAGDSIVDATYVFPMSNNAAVYGMEMIIDDRIVEAVIKRKDEAQMLFEQADSSGLTATLLEQERPNVFQMSLANINPSDTLVVRMFYTELLIPTNGEYEWVFPNIVGPRFTAGGEPWVQQAADQSIPLEETALNINLKINAGMPVQAYCDSHNLDFVESENATEANISTFPGADFIANYSLNRDQIQTGLLLYEGEEENFFLSIIQPAKPEVQFDSPPREYVFIMDISGSMSGFPLTISKELMLNLLNDIDPSDKFNIMVFAGGNSTLAPNSIEATPANIQLASNFVDNLNSGGSTQLLPAMQNALNMEISDDFSRTFVILTDGYVTVEKEAYDLIRENLGEANFFSFGIGTSVNRYIIDGIAYVGEGEPFVVTSSADADEMAATFKSFLEKPVLTNIEATFDNIEAYDIEPLSIPDVFAERPIIIYGKYNLPAEGSISISGDFANGTVAETFDFSDYEANADQNIALKYLWARKRIKLMADYGIASNENDTISIEEEITQLGLKYSLITDYTSFVAIDSGSASMSGPTEVDPEGGGDTFDGIELVGLPFNQVEEDLMKILGNVVDTKLKVELTNLPVTNDGALSLQIKDLSGNMILSVEINSDNYKEIKTIMLDHLPQGLYILSLFQDATLLDFDKFIIQH